MDRRTKQRRYCILASGCFTRRLAETAHGLIAYGRDPVVAVIDPELAGKTVREAVPYLRSDAPIVADLDAALDFAPNALLIGAAPANGALPADWRDAILAALRAGLEVVGGLHESLADDAEFAEAAYYGGASIWDLRTAPAPRAFSGAAFAVAPFVLLTVGGDVAVGKTSACFEIVRAACERKRNPEFVATGPTGVVVAGKGAAIDHVVADFATGAVESLVTGCDPETDLLVVEGQGGINHPAVAPVALALLHGAAPDALVLVHDPTRTEIEGFPTPVLPPAALIPLYEALANTVKPAPVVGVILHTAGLDETAALAAIERHREELKLPVDDVVRFGAQAFYDAIAPRLIAKTVPLVRARAASA